MFQPKFTDVIMNNVKPIEEEFPLIGELIKDVCNRKYSRFNVKSIIFLKDDVILIPHRLSGRNELCWCGSGLKTKRCNCNMTK